MLGRQPLHIEARRTDDRAELSQAERRLDRAGVQADTSVRLGDAEFEDRSLDPAVGMSDRLTALDSRKDHYEAHWLCETTETDNRQLGPWQASGIRGLCALCALGTCRQQRVPLRAWAIDR